VLKVRTTIILLVIGGLLLIPAVRADAWASEDPREVVEAYRIWKLTEALDLSEEQMFRFFAQLRAIEEADEGFKRDERRALRGIAELLGKDDVDEGDFEKALAKYERIRTDRFEEMTRLRREAASMLSARQRCQYVVFEERFRSELREMISRVREMREAGRMEDRGRFGEPRDGGGFGEGDGAGPRGGTPGGRGGRGR
jgi:Spy/CpxP family protein refolding chaperone